MYHKIFKLHAELLKALAHPKRLEILNLLRSGEMCVSDMQHMLDLPQGHLCQHLEILRNAGVAETRREGKQVFYKVAHADFIKASDLLREVLVEKYQGDPIARELKADLSMWLPLKHDPVCGMRLSPKTASYAVKHGGEKYFFCAKGCLNKFKIAPQKFIHKQEGQHV